MTQSIRTRLPMFAMVAVMAAIFAAPAAAAPGVTTEEATEVGAGSAILHATIDTDGQKTIYAFQYGPTTEYGSFTAVEIIEAGAEAPVEVEAMIQGLEPETTYHFQAGALIYNRGSFMGKDVTFTTPERRRPRLEADEYPADISFNRDSAGEPVFTRGGGGPLTCETSQLDTSLSEAASVMSVAAQYGGCEFLGESATVQMNSCHYLYDVADELAPYTGTVQIACGEAEDGIEVDVPALNITVTVPAQAPESNVAYENEGEGSTASVDAEVSAEGIESTCEGSAFNCFLAGGATSTNGSFEDGLTLEGQNEAEEAIGVRVAGGDPVGMYVSGEESEEEAAQPRFDAQEFPINVRVDRDSAGEPVFTRGEGQALICETSQLDTSLSEAASELSVAAQYGGCEFVGEPATVQMNSCHYLYGVDNADPPYTGTVQIACGEAEDGIEVDVPALNITVTVPAQAPESNVAYENEGEGSTASVDAEVSAEGIESTCEGNAFNCFIAGGATSTNGSFEDGLTLNAVL